MSASFLQLQRGCTEAIGFLVQRAYACRRVACPSVDTGMPVPIPSFEQSVARSLCTAVYKDLRCLSIDHDRANRS